VMMHDAYSDQEPPYSLGNAVGQPGIHTDQG